MRFWEPSTPKCHHALNWYSFGPHNYKTNDEKLNQTQLNCYGVFFVHTSANYETWLKFFTICYLHIRILWIMIFQCEETNIFCFDKVAYCISVLVFKSISLCRCVIVCYCYCYCGFFNNIFSVFSRVSMKVASIQF